MPTGSRQRDAERRGPADLRGQIRGLAALLRGQIEDGTLTNRVPSVKTLSQEHGVSHITAEKALAVLKDEGIILNVIGKGTFVANR